jgi:hypothetical protein
MTGFSEKSINPVYLRVKNLLGELGEEMISEKDEENYWKLDIRHGSTLVSIFHDKKRKYMSVIYPNSIQDTGILKKINGAFEDEKGGFDRKFTFYSSISSPLTGYIMYSNDSGFTGYDIFAKIFPFEPDFTLWRVDDAIQRVVSVGTRGTAFLKSLLNDPHIEYRIVAHKGAGPAAGDNTMYM